MSKQHTPLTDEIRRAKAEAWEEGWDALADAIETCTVAGGEPCGAPFCAMCDQDNPYREEPRD